MVGSSAEKKESEDRVKFIILGSLTCEAQSRTTEKTPEGRGEAMEHHFRQLQQFLRNLLSPCHAN